MDPIKLDYSLKTVEERKALVEKIISTAPSSQLTSKYLEILSNYILDIAIDKKEKKITTANRQITIDKRETSYEDLVSKFENGEDGVYNLINNDKNMYLTQHLEISNEDIEEIPGLRELRENILRIEEEAKRATGKRKFLLKKQAIEMRQEQYILRDLWRQPLHRKTASHSTAFHCNLDEEIVIGADGEPVSNALISFFNPEHVSAILCNLALLREGLEHKHHSDFHYLLLDFEKLMRAALDSYPAYKTLADAKIEGQSNADIQKLLIEKHNLAHTPEYISALWRNKIPKIIADKAKDDYLIWYYSNIKYGTWKRCSQCGEWKLAHPRFFSRNGTAKDGYYSMCKVCRNARTAAQRRLKGGLNE